MAQREKEWWLGIMCIQKRDCVAIAYNQHSDCACIHIVVHGISTSFPHVMFGHWALWMKMKSAPTSMDAKKVLRHIVFMDPLIQ